MENAADDSLTLVGGVWDTGVLDELAGRPTVMQLAVSLESAVDALSMLAILAVSAVECCVVGWVVKHAMDLRY